MELAKNVMNECYILKQKYAEKACPFIPKLEFAFQSNSKLYLGMPY